MPFRSAALASISGSVAAIALSAAVAQTTPPAQPLKTPAEFAGVADRAERSRALFTEIGRVLTHPRCMNCHPAGDHPLQGADYHEHFPPAWRPETAAFADRCHSCHTDANYTLHEAASYRSIPGHPRWGLAPLELAWE